MLSENDGYHTLSCCHTIFLKHLHIATDDVTVFHFCLLGPGLAIRVICAEEPYVCKDFPETNNILKIIADFSASVKKVILVTNTN